MNQTQSSLINPQSKLSAQLNIKPAINSAGDLKLEDMINQVKAILIKPPQTRNNIENKILNKFSKKSNFFSAIAENSAPDVAQGILKYAHIYQIAKNRTIVSKGQQLQYVIVLLSGKFGIVDSGEQTKNEPQKQQTQIYKKTIQNSLKIARDLKRRIKQIPQDPSQILQFKTTKATMFQLTFKRYIENQQQVFNLNSLINGRKYSESLVTCKNSTILAIKSKHFYQSLGSYVRKVKSDKISAFRKFEYFSCIQSERLIQLVDQLPLITMKKGQFVYRQGQQMKNIYLLIKGSIKITKTVDLFRQNPNLFYMNRQKIPGSKKLSFADFSQIYNYKPRKKIIQLGITNQLSIFGEQQFYSQTNLRQTNVQVNSQCAVFYDISIEKLEQSLNDIKGFMSQLKQGLFKDQTEKKILYRQQKLSELLICQTKNNMDYFFIQQQLQNQQSPRHQYSPRKYKISKVNQFISPLKNEKPKQSPIKEAAYHTFNFNNFPLNSSSSSPRKKNVDELNQNQNKIFELVHTLGVRPKSRNADEFKNQQRAKYLKSPRKTNVNTRIQIDIHNPLFELSYFHKNRKQILRLQKETRKRPLTTSTKSKSTLKPSTSRTMEKSSIF